MRHAFCISMMLLVVLNGIEAFAQTSLEIHVNNIKSKKGSIQFALFTTEADYLKNPVEKKIIKSNGNEVTVVFENLQPGDYSLSVIHDENENGELIPTHLVFQRRDSRSVTMHLVRLAHLRLKKPRLQ